MQDAEIDLIELAKTIWDRRMFVAKVTGFFVLVGLLIAFTSKVEYVASCKLLPENQEGVTSNLGGLSSLAGLAGINLNMNSNGALNPQLYPQIAQSHSFISEILNDTIYYENLGLHTTPLYFFKELDSPSLPQLVFGYTIGLPFRLKELLSSEKKTKSNDATYGYTRISKSDFKIYKTLKNRLQVSVDIETGITEIKVEMPDPMAATMLCENVVNGITKKVTNYKTEKVKSNLDFIESSYSEAKDKFEKTQQQLAMATDRNRIISSAVAEIELQKLQNEYDLAFEVYKGLSTQVEQAKISLRERTPVFTILEGVRVPEDKSKPNRPIILIVFTLLGGLISTGKIVVFELLKNVK